MIGDTVRWLAFGIPFFSVFLYCCPRLLRDGGHADAVPGQRRATAPSTSPPRSLLVPLGRPGARRSPTALSYLVAGVLAVVACCTGDPWRSPAPDDRGERPGRPHPPVARAGAGGRGRPGGARRSGSVAASGSGSLLVRRDRRGASTLPRGRLRPGTSTGSMRTSVTPSTHATTATAPDWRRPRGAAPCSRP